MAVRGKKLGCDPVLPKFVKERLHVIRDICRRCRVQVLYLYGSAVTGAYERGVSDLYFMVDFTPEAHDRYDGPETYIFGYPPTESPAAYSINYAALQHELGLVFADYATTAKDRIPIDIGTYSCINNKFFKQMVDEQKVKLYGD